MRSLAAFAPRRCIWGSIWPGRAPGLPEGGAPWTVVAAVARARANGILIAGYNARAADLVRSLRRAFGSRLTIITGDGFLPISETERRIGPAADGMYVSLSGIPTASLTPAGRQLLAAFQATQHGSTIPSGTYLPEAAPGGGGSGRRNRPLRRDARIGPSAAPPDQAEPRPLRRLSLRSKRRHHACPVHDRSHYRWTRRRQPRARVSRRRRRSDHSRPSRAAQRTLTTSSRGRYRLLRGRARRKHGPSPESVRRNTAGGDDVGPDEEGRPLIARIATFEGGDAEEMGRRSACCGA